MKYSRLLTVLVFISVQSARAGTLTYENPFRGVGGIVDILGLKFFDGDTTPNLGYWEDEGMVTVSSGDLEGHAHATQMSTFGFNFISGTLWSQTHSVGPPGDVLAVGLSQLETDFTLDEATPFVVAGTIDTSGNEPGMEHLPIVSLMDSDEDEIFAFDSIGDFYQDGILDAGTYSLVIESRIHDESGSGLPATTQLDLNLTIPEPATILTLIVAILFLPRRARPR